jgi:hypothetical protein
MPGQEDALDLIKYARGVAGSAQIDLSDYSALLPVDVNGLDSDSLLPHRGVNPNQKFISPALHCLNEFS